MPLRVRDNGSAEDRADRQLISRLLDSLQTTLNSDVGATDEFSISSWSIYFRALRYTSESLASRERVLCTLVRKGSQLRQSKSRPVQLVLQRVSSYERLANRYHVFSYRRVDWVVFVTSSTVLCLDHADLV